MPQTFSNLLETIEDTSITATSYCCVAQSQCLSAAIFKQNSIREIGQPIVIGQMFDLGRALFDQLLQVIFIKRFLGQQM